MNNTQMHTFEKVAASYEEILVPALFAQWPNRLADAADVEAGQSILDVACGTGILARTVAERMGQNGSVTGVDLNPAMLAVARRLSSEITWHEADAAALPYEDESFDAVLCQLALMFFSGPEAALKECRRVMKTGGRLAAAVFGSLEEIPVYAAIADVYERVVGKSVGDALRMPFSMGDRRRLAAIAAGAGIASTEIVTLEDRARFPSTESVVLSDVKGWFPFAEIELDDETIAAVCKELDTTLQPYKQSNGAVDFPVRVHIVAGSK